MFHVPLALLSGLAAWILGLLAFTRALGEATLPLLSLSLAMGSALFGQLEPSRWKDGLAIVALGVAFLTATSSAAGVGLFHIFLFGALALLTFQFMTFRTTIATVRGLPSLREEIFADLGAVYVAMVVRSIFAAVFVLLISAMVFMAASGFVFATSLDIVPFGLALVVLLLLLLIYRFQPETSG